MYSYAPKTGWRGISRSDPGLNLCRHPLVALLRRDDVAPRRPIRGWAIVAIQLELRLDNVTDYGWHVQSTSFDGFTNLLISWLLSAHKEEMVLGPSHYRNRYQHTTSVACWTPISLGSTPQSIGFKLELHVNLLTYLSLEQCKNPHHFKEKLEGKFYSRTALCSNCAYFSLLGASHVG